MCYEEINTDLDESNSYSALDLAESCHQTTPTSGVQESGRPRCPQITLVCSDLPSGSLFNIVFRTTSLDSNGDALLDSDGNELVSQRVHCDDFAKSGYSGFILLIINFSLQTDCGCEQCYRDACSSRNRGSFGNIKILKNCNEMS